MNQPELERLDLLEAWLDGELEDTAQRDLAQRLTEDAELRQELRELAHLRRQVRDLPRELMPPSDLWPRIESRLDVDSSSVRRGPWRSGARRPAPAFRLAWAALLGVAAGGILIYLSMTAGLGGPATSTSSSSPGFTPATNAVNAAYSDGYPGDFPNALGDETSVRIEADFLRARESLWVELLANRDQLPPETWQVVVENLNLLDRVIRELRVALQQDPGNRRLERMLLANHQRQLDLLRRLVRQV